MKTDPVVDEVRAAREKLFAEYNYDLAVMVADLRERENLHGNRVVSLRGKQESEKGKAA